MAEVGVSTSMAAAAFTACMGGSIEQILQAAEIGMFVPLLSLTLSAFSGRADERDESSEHSLGLTCDPIDGLVAIPCIERNALGSVKAVTAAQLALAGDGEHSVTLDEAIEAMRLTARDMHSHYKETSLSGLAVSFTYLRFGTRSLELTNSVRYNRRASRFLYHLQLARSRNEQ